MSRYIGNGDWMATVAKIKPHRWRFFLSVADESLHISDRVVDTDPFSVAEGVFGPFPMCRSVLVDMTMIKLFNHYVGLSSFTGMMSLLVPVL